MLHAHHAAPVPSDAVDTRALGEMAVAKNLLRLRFCISCNTEMTDEICCTCETPTVLKTSA
jgi:hypothetical protein